MFVGLVAVVVNLVAALLIQRPIEVDLNVRPVFIHFMADFGSSAAAVITGVVMYFTGADWLDPLVSVFIGFVMACSAWRILRQAVDIVLESAPLDVDLIAEVKDAQRITRALGVQDPHDWSLTAEPRTMSGQVLTDDVPLSTANRIERALSELLSAQYWIAYATLQLEYVGCDPGALYCKIDETARLQR